MKVIFRFTFCCNNLWKSKFMALEKPGKLGEFFLRLCGHPVSIDKFSFVYVHRLIYSVCLKCLPCPRTQRVNEFIVNALFNALPSV